MGEDSVLEPKAVEFSENKVTGPHKDGMADELAAMANTASGIIVLGSGSACMGRSQSQYLPG